MKNMTKKLRMAMIDYMRYAICDYDCNNAKTD